MATAPALQTALTTTSEATPPVGVAGFVRLRPCSRCGGRRRALKEVSGGGVTSHCLRCGSPLGAGLETEHHPVVALVGRGGQSRRAS